MTRKRSLIWIVDDEARICASLESILKTYGYDSKSFNSVDDFLIGLHVMRPDVVLLDVRMPGIDGLEAQRMLATQEESPPVIIMSGHGDVAMAVSAMKNGAHDFIEKPIDDERLAASIAQVLAQNSSRLGIRERFGRLSPRERLVAALVAKGYSTLAIASDLGISNRTVDHHRASILEKMEATSLSQLMSLLMEIGLHRH